MTFPMFYTIAGCLSIAFSMFGVAIGILTDNVLLINAEVVFGLVMAGLTLLFSHISTKRGFPRFPVQN